MTRQAWWCEDCAARGYVDHDQHAGVWQVFTAIKDDHSRLADSDCHGDRIRVQNEAWVAR